VPPDCVDSVRRFFAACEHVRFAPSAGVGDMQGALSLAQQILRRLERERSLRLAGQIPHSVVPERLELGGLFRIKIFFPMDTVLSTIQAIAKVVWVDSAIQKTAGEYRYGLQLQSFLKGDLNKFRKLLKEVGHAHN